MKVREFAGRLGVQAKPRTYGFEVCVLDLPGDGMVETIDVDAKGYGVRILQSLSKVLSECRPFIKEIKSLNFNVFGFGTAGPGAVH